jgi:hypothetical protein
LGAALQVAAMENVAEKQRERAAEKERELAEKELAEHGTVSRRASPVAKLEKKWCDDD